MSKTRSQTPGAAAPTSQGVIADEKVAEGHFRVSKKWLNATFSNFHRFCLSHCSRAAKPAKNETLWVFIRSDAHPPRGPSLAPARQFTLCRQSRMEHKGLRPLINPGVFRQSQVGRPLFSLFQRWICRAFPEHPQPVLRRQGGLPAKSALLSIRARGLPAPLLFRFRFPALGKQPLLHPVRADDPLRLPHSVVHAGYPRRVPFPEQLPGARVAVACDWPANIDKRFYSLLRRIFLLPSDS